MRLHTSPRSGLSEANRAQRRSVSFPDSPERPPAPSGNDGAAAPEPAIRCLGRAWRGRAVRLRTRGGAHQVGRGPVAAEIDAPDGPQLLRLLAAPAPALERAYLAGEIRVRGDLGAILEGRALTAESMAGARLAAALRRLWDRGGPAARLHHRADLRRAAHARAELPESGLAPSPPATSAFFVTGQEGLAAAEEQKIALLLRKLRPVPGQRLLAIECGGVLFRAAERHGLHATGVTADAAEAEALERRARQRGLGHLVRVIHGDWRAVDGPFDRIVCAGALDRANRRARRDLLRRCRALLNGRGLALLEAVARPREAPADPWAHRGVRPAGPPPALDELVRQAERAGLRVADAENLRRHYAITLAGWSRTLDGREERQAGAPAARSLRAARLALCAAETAFRRGDLDLWQLVLHRPGHDAWPLNRDLGIAPGFAARRPEKLAWGSRDASFDPRGRALP